MRVFWIRTRMPVRSPPWARDAVAFSITNKLLVPDGKILPQSPISVKALRYAIGQIGMAD